MQSTTTVGILFPGELGAALGALLVPKGIRVVTSVRGRSARTSRLCAAAKLEELESAAHVIREANLLLSLVPPGAAPAIARQYLGAMHEAPPDAIFVEANSIGPTLCASLAAEFSAAGGHFVDASIHGPATALASNATLYLSGGRAGEVAALFDNAMRVQIIGNEPGRASAMKMLLAGLSKGMCALYLETASLARRQGMFDEMNGEATHFYGGMVAAIERMLPTYPRHASRRVIEIRELAETCRQVEQEPCVLGAVQRLLEDFTRIEFNPEATSRWTVAEIVERLVEGGFLSGGAPPKFRAGEDHGQ